MQNTFNSSSAWLDQQTNFIASLQLQPLVVVLRPGLTELETASSSKSLFSLIEQLHFDGVKHIEIAWSAHPSWMALMQELNSAFSGISLGAASVTSTAALESVSALGLDYAMTPIWDPALQTQAISLKQLLVPGVRSPTEIQQAKSFGCQLVKLFPASTLGIKCIHNFRAAIGSVPFAIAAGGLTVKDLNSWLNEGYGALVLGKGLVNNYQVDPQLQEWLRAQK